MGLERILISVNVRWWNAEAAYALNLARGLRNKGLKVWMVVDPNSPVHKKAEKYKIPVITDISRNSFSPFQQWRNFKKLTSLIDNLDIQVVNSYKSQDAFLFAMARRFRPRLLYVRTRGEARPPKKNIFNRWLYSERSCDGVIAAGKLVKTWLDDLGASQKNLKVIYYGDSSLQPTGDDPALTRKRLNIPLSAKVLTLLGRSQRVKGHLTLLQALAALKHKNFHLLFLIKDPDEFPEELQAIKDFIQTRDLKHKTTILGFQENLADVLSATDIGVIPSLGSEVNCRAAVEFFSLGIPVMAFPVGSLPDIIRHKKNGYLCSSTSVADLTEGIEWMTGEKADSQKISETARADYLEKYTLDKLAENYMKFFESISSSGKASSLPT